MRRTVVLSGTVEQMSRAFVVDLGIYDAPSGRYRGREGAVSIPEEIADIVQAVLGLDNRPLGRPHIRAAIAPQTTTPLTPPALATLYDFPASVSAAGQTIGIIEFGGYKISDIQSFFKGLNLTTPTVTAVGVDGAKNSPGAPADAEVVLDIDVAGSVAQGANIVVYFAPNTEQGYADCISSAVHDAKSQPSVPAISWGGVESNFTAAGIAAVSAQLQAASVLGVTVFSTSGDNGSADVTIDGKAQVIYPGSDPWITCCGGTSVSNVSGSSFTETTWKQTGGGISDLFDLPDWQGQAGVPSSANRGHRIGRGVPDVSGNADPNSGYVLTPGGLSVGPFGGTSAVAPFYAGLVALLNANLGEPVGYLNYNLYAFDGGNVYRDIADNVSTASGPAPGYRSGPGWDACTGLGSINGNALLDALRGVGLPVALADYNAKLYMAWKGMERDDRIFWSAFDGKSWAAQQHVTGVSKSAGPALEVFDGKLYMVWKGMADDQRIWYSYFDGSKWAPQKQLSGVSTSTGPSLGVYADKLYMAWKGMEGDQRIWYNSFDGRKWAPQQAVPGVSTSVGPCITTFAGELHMAWKGMYGDQRIWFSHFDGVRWAAQQVIPGVSTSEGPQLCPFNGRLYAVWKGAHGDQRLWYSRYDSTAWTAQQQIPGVSSSVGAGLMVFESVLYAAWKGMLGDQRIWYASFNGVNWVPKARFPALAPVPISSPCRRQPQHSPCRPRAAAKLNHRPTHERGLE